MSRAAAKTRDARPRRTRVTMAEVGRIAGVSQVTVSRALSDPSKVSPETYGRIREAIEMTGFVPNAIAGALASRRSKLVTALVPSLINIVYSSLIKTFSEPMRRNGYQILLSESGFDPKEEEALIAAHLSRRPDAVLLTGIHHTPLARRMLLGAEIPVIEIWDTTESPIDICIGFSHQKAGQAVAEFALEAGYTAAACVSANDERALRRKSAFVASFSQRQSAPVPEVILQSPASLAGGRTGLSQLVDEKGFGSGVIFCSSDLIAHGIIIEAGVRGLRIPEDVAVIGFGDQDFAEFVEPALTTVRVDREALGRMAAEALLARIHGQAPPESVTDIGFEIVRRRSA